jgi:hypothetical protein
MTPYQSRLKKSGYRTAFCQTAIKLDFRYDFVLTGLGVKADGGAVGNVEELTEFRYGDEVFVIENSGSGS